MTPTDRKTKMSSEKNADEAYRRHRFFLDGQVWDVDQVVTNHFGERVWLGPRLDAEGKRVGITNCCLVDEPCAHHTAWKEQHILRLGLRRLGPKEKVKATDLVFIDDQPVAVGGKISMSKLVGYAARRSEVYREDEAIQPLT